MVETPFALQAARDLSHAPCGDKKSKDLPAGAVKVLDVREPRQQKAGKKCAQRKHDAAHERLLPKMDEGKARPHNFLL